MNVGLPGTGLGGIFYILTAFIILFIELIAFILGKTTRKRFLFGMKIATVAGLMTAALLITPIIVFIAHKIINHTVITSINAKTGFPISFLSLSILLVIIILIFLLNTLINGRLPFKGKS